MHDIAMNLIASGDVEARERLSEGLPTAGLVVIDFAGRQWSKAHAQGGRLERFVTPRSLAARPCVRFRDRARRLRHRCTSRPHPGDFSGRERVA